MAISRIRPRYTIEGHSIATVLADHIDYDKNPEEINYSLLVTGYQCSSGTVWQEFMINKQIYTATIGRRHTPGKDVISYLLMQFSKPGTITPGDTNKLGYKIAMESTHDGHQFIVTTHMDGHHIHNVHPGRAMRRAV